jgi:hypothetical protein
LESAQEAHRQAVLQVQRAHDAILTDGSSDPVDGEGSHWSDGSPLGWAPADVALHVKPHPVETKVDLRLQALQAAMNPVAGGVMAWVAKRTRGLNVGDLLVVIPENFGSNILRVDPTTGDVSVVDPNKVSKLSAVLFRAGA